MIAVASQAWIDANDWRALGYVAVVDRARAAEHLPVAVADWSPDARIAALDRLAGTFGSEAVKKLVNGLAGLLQEALAAPDHEARAAVAHRVAGLAGTLGFAAVGREWLRVAEGERPPADYLRRITRHALETIAQTQRR